MDTLEIVLWSLVIQIAWVAFVAWLGMLLFPLLVAGAFTIGFGQAFVGATLVWLASLLFSTGSRK